MTLPSFSQARSGPSIPSEEHPHQATFMMWPSSRTVHTDPVFLRMLQGTIVEIANTIAAFEPVILLAAGSLHGSIQPMLRGDITLWDIPTEDLWARDAGPLFAVQDGRQVISHIQFNGWGEKQINIHDSQVSARVADRLGLPLVPAGLKGEPGGVEWDGRATLMAHRSSWLIDNRNPGLSEDQITQRLMTAFGAQRVIWSDGVWNQDITDYHIDSLARFTGPERVLINLPSNPDMTDPFHTAAQDTHDVLVDAGLDLDVIYEPNVRRVNSIDFVASYVNFYVCNGAVIAPHFGDSNMDAQATSALRRHYPDREIVTLNTDPLGEVGGGIHCATQQWPAT
ncbi:MAG: agmatine deiminase family protein [Pseudomonadota bacterium]